jgi:glycosyltransferase involved in cell wall biosynthesis
MNQEYVLLGSLVWKLLGKKVYLWRNHWAGSVFTRAAVALADGVFCTSKFSYTAKFAKTKLMPVGIDIELFRPVPNTTRSRSILFLGRLAPSKRPDLFIEALETLASSGTAFSGDIYGDALPRDRDYRESLVARVQKGKLASSVQFHTGVPNTETPPIYSAHDIFINCSGSGMYDKTIFEAAACGCIVLAESRDWGSVADARLSYKEGDANDLAKKIKELSALSESEKEQLRKNCMALAQAQSLRSLAEGLVRTMQHTV